MGQLALGFRSLIIKAAVFVVLASLLAWALGGTLWPRPQVAQMQSVHFAGSEWNWQLAVGGARNAPSWVRWTMMRSTGNHQAVAFDDRVWKEAAGPIATDSALYYAGRMSDNDGWWLIVVNESGNQVSIEMLDRLAIEQQFERLKAGLPLQSFEVIAQQRGHVLDP